MWPDNNDVDDDELIARYCVIIVLDGISASVSGCSEVLFLQV